jgi:DNA polymerase elongation subunit (family B)
LEDKRGEDTSIYGTPLKKREFDTLWDRNKFVKESGITRVFENIPPYQQFLIDNYFHCNGDEDFSKNPLKVMILDIECPGVPGGKFPEPELAENVIDLLSCYDTLTKKYTVFGLKAYTPKAKNVVYTHCKSEHDLLKKFIGHFSSDYPDCLVGWNSAGFDIPYIVNRITFELGKEWADELSPLGRIYEKINKQGKFGAPSKEYVIEGISCVDYFVLYKKFAMEPLESYKLSYVAEFELDDNKVDYVGSLAELSIKDWETYVDYNLQDVKLIVDLDDKLRYIELLRFISYLALCNMENAIKTNPVITGAIAIRARYRNEKIPTFVRNGTGEKIAGAYVAPPKLGFSKNIVSFDANSLYPSVMITGNMSPETKVGSVEKIGDMFHIRHVTGRTYEMTKDNYLKYIKAEQITRSESNILFSQKKVGIMPEFLDFLYTKRKEMKAKMSALKKELKERKGSMTKKEISAMESDIQKYDTFQHAYKITLNSTYGYCANKFAPLGDREIGESVTLTGQSVIKKSNELVMEFLTSKYPEVVGYDNEILIYNDTDSCYLSLGILEQFGINLKRGDKINPEFYDLCDQLENYINDGCNAWAKRRLWSTDARFVFKRESICSSGIFVKKKYYVLHVLDDEGIQVDKFKYKGVDVVKTTMPKPLKPYVKKIIETMITTQSMSDTNEAFMNTYDIFKGLNVEQIYTNMGVNNYDKYANECNEFQTAKKMPAQLKRAYWHNLILDKLGIADKYPKFRSGDKIKMVYLKKPNRYGIDSIGFKGTYPKEFDEIFEIDYEMMFGKILYASIERFYKSVNWILRKPNENVKIELEDFFS